MNDIKYDEMYYRITQENIRHTKEIIRILENNERDQEDIINTTNEWKQFKHVGSCADDTAKNPMDRSSENLKKNISFKLSSHNIDDDDDSIVVIGVFYDTTLIDEICYVSGVLVKRMDSRLERKLELDHLRYYLDNLKILNEYIEYYGSDCVCYIDNISLLKKYAIIINQKYDQETFDDFLNFLKISGRYTRVMVQLGQLKYNKDRG